MAAEQVAEEPEAETECQRARGMPSIRGARVEPERLRTKVELAGGRSPTEPVGQSDEVQPEEWRPEAMAGRCPTNAELVDRRVTVEARELGVEVEPLGLRRLEVEVRDSPATATMEDGRPTELAPYRWWAEAEQRGCQTTAVEEAGAGGCVVGYS